MGGREGSSSGFGKRGRDGLVVLSEGDWEAVAICASFRWRRSLGEVASPASEFASPVVRRRERPCRALTGAVSKPSPPLFSS
jgi:hypothetical protein